MFNKEQLKKTPVLSPENGETQESEVKEAQKEIQEKELEFGPIRPKKETKEDRARLIELAKKSLGL